MSWKRPAQNWYNCEIVPEFPSVVEVGRARCAYGNLNGGFLHGSF